METGELDLFVIMETEFLKQRKKGIKPVVIGEYNCILMKSDSHFLTFFPFHKIPFIAAPMAVTVIAIIQ